MELANKRSTTIIQGLIIHLRKLAFFKRKFREEYVDALECLFEQKRIKAIETR